MTGGEEADRAYKLIPHGIYSQYMTCPISLIPYGWLKDRLGGRSPLTLNGMIAYDPTNELNYPIVSAELVPDTSKFPTKTKIRCQIIGPIAEGFSGAEELTVSEKSIDMDLDLFNALPDTAIFDSATGHLPSA